MTVYESWSPWANGGPITLVNHKNSVPIIISLIQLILFPTHFCKKWKLSTCMWCKSGKKCRQILVSTAIAAWIFRIIAWLNIQVIFSHTSPYLLDCILGLFIQFYTFPSLGRARLASHKNWNYPKGIKMWKECEYIVRISGLDTFRDKAFWSVWRGGGEVKLNLGKDYQKFSCFRNGSRRTI